MEPLNSSSRRPALRALALVMAAAVAAWVLFIAGQYFETVNTATSDWEYGDPERITWTQYLTVAAIVVLGLGALLAKRGLARIRAEDAPRSRLVDPVSQLASVSSIVAAALATFAVFAVFMGGFFSGDADPAPVARIVNLYLPIVLYTVLVVTLILAGFVFVPAASRQHLTVLPDGPAPANAQRTTALAYATPIIAAAIALVLGLIVYDVTRTALQAWIWVVILVIIGAGVLAGALFAQRSAGESPIEPPVVAGAKNLNFVLSIVFATVVAGMSLGYGMSAVYGLNVMPSLSVSAYSDSETSIDPDGEKIEYADPDLSAYGSDLKRGSEGTLTLEATGEGAGEAVGVEIGAAQVDRDKWLSIDGALPEGLPAGEYELVAQAVSADDREIEVTLPITVVESGKVLLPKGTDAGNDDEGRLLPVTAGWVFGDLLPAGVMLGLGVALIAATLTVRNRDD